MNEQAAATRRTHRNRLLCGVIVALFAFVAMFCACKSSGKTEPTAQAAIDPASYDPPANAARAPTVTAERAFKLTGDFVAVGPRALGTPGHKKAEDFIHQKLNGLQVEDDAFQGQTAAGVFPMRNIVAKIPGKRDGIIVIAGHYETNLPLKDRNYVGANDGGSSTGLMLEIADELKGKQLDGYSIWIAFLDGEEATKTWSADDSLYGSKHLAARWQQDGTAKKIKAFLLLDMIGDADLNIERDGNSTPWLEDVIGRAAMRLGNQKYFYGRDLAIEDDHLPFARIGVPVADLIDINYGFDNIFHHTTEDTMDKLSPHSLQVVGDTVMETIRALNTR